MSDPMLWTRFIESQHYWRAFHYGFTAGYRAGYSGGLDSGRITGHDQANQEWTDITTAACRAGLNLTRVAEAEARRRQLTAGPQNTSLSGAELVRIAHRSWGLPSHIHHAA